MKCTTNKTVFQLGRSYPSYCGCNPCKCGSSSNGGFILPSGGTDGNVLIKNGNGVTWASFSALEGYNNTVGF